MAADRMFRMIAKIITTSRGSVPGRMRLAS
jgi:hypothetical protein